MATDRLSWIAPAAVPRHAVVSDERSNTRPCWENSSPRKYCRVGQGSFSLSPSRGRRSPASLPTRTYMRIYRTTLFGIWFTALCRGCNSASEAQFWFSNGVLALIWWYFSSQAPSGPAVAAQHPMPVTLPARYTFTSIEASPPNIKSIVSAYEGVDFADLVTDRTTSPYELLQGRKAAPRARFLGAIPTLKSPFQVLQRQLQKVDRFRALSAAFTRVSPREPTELN